MGRILSGSELVGYIKERQARQVRALRQAERIVPRLAIVMPIDASPVIQKYVAIKRRYAEDILVEVDVYELHDDDMLRRIAELSEDRAVHGIIVQLPLEDEKKTESILRGITPSKDVDGLGPEAEFAGATAEAISWLLAGYDIDLRGKAIVIVGQGRLVGAPLAKMWKQNGYEVAVCDNTTPDVPVILRTADIIVSATGVPRLIKSDMLPIGAVVVDAGTASEGGVIVGDIEEVARERSDLSITPLKGGVGPLTVAVLFEHLLLAARKSPAGSPSSTEVLL